jgi:hypothetical protein
VIEIKVTTHNGETELAKMEIERVGGNRWSGNYTVRIVVNRGKRSFGIHQRGFDYFSRIEYNVLGLIRQALNTLDEKELRLESDVSSTDMEREERGALPALPGKTEGSVHHHRPPFWRR